MADENGTGLEGNEGQSTEGSETTTQMEPGNTGEQSVEGSGTTEEGHQNVETVFDPVEFKKLTENLSPELVEQAMALQKGLQGAYTKKFQDITDNKSKIEAYDAFYSDPGAQLQKMAQQLGYNVTGPGVQTEQEGEFDPQTWDDVTNMIQSSVLQKLAPLLNEVQTMKKSTVETQLSDIDPGWKQYETEMMTNLKAHPTLSKDPSMLYRLSVPANVLESRATQQALARMKEKVNSGKVAGSSTTTRTSNDGLPNKSLSFNEAVKAAKAKLAKDGVHDK